MALPLSTIARGVLQRVPSLDCETRSSRPPLHALHTQIAVKRPLLGAALRPDRSGAPVSDTPTGAPNEVPLNLRAKSRCDPPGPERVSATRPAPPPATAGTSPAPIPAGGVQLPLSLRSPPPA